MLYALKRFLFLAAMLHANAQTGESFTTYWDLMY
jgi:hypothetical protein